MIYDQFEILKLEYQQSSSLFQRGFDLIFNMVREFLYFNGIMFGALGLSIRLENIEFTRKIVLILGAIGILGALTAYIIHRRMAGYLRMWLQRAKEVEEELGGKLYCRTYEMEYSGRKLIFQSYRLFLSFYILFVSAWCYIIYVFRS